MIDQEQKEIRGFFNKAKAKIKKTFSILGPGFITGAADDDPSGIGTYSIAGAQYGLRLLWLIPFQLPLMYAMQHMAGRIGLLSGQGLAVNMKRYFPAFLVYSSLASLVIANAINIGADISIMGSSMELVLGYHAGFWAVLATVFIVAVEIFISYHTYSKILFFLSCFLLSYIVTALMTTESWSEVLYFMFIPHMQWDKEFLLVMAGFIGTTISPYLFFWQAAQEIEENLDHKSARQVDQLVEDLPMDTFIGMFFSQLMTLCIVLTCFSTLHKHGITQITSAHEAAIALKPFAGACASLIFSLGIIGAGLLGIPVLAGSSAYALSELLDKPRGLDNTFNQARFFYGVIATSTFVGLAINFLGINPIQALLYAAIINCVVAVPFIAFVLILSNKKEIMREHVNGPVFNLLGVVTLLLAVGAAILPFI
jgi:NRAMP (natural resistance-associated macrophage protein)-like metal ion transporter